MFVSSGTGNAIAGRDELDCHREPPALDERERGLQTDGVIAGEWLVPACRKLRSAVPPRPA